MAGGFMLINIIGFILIFVALSIGGLFFALYKKRFEESLILSMGFIIVFLYISYILNILHFGYIILLLLMGCILVYSIFKFIKSDNKKEILSYFFTPGFVIYTICFVIIFLIVRYNRVLLWDELRLWGAYPKILYYNGALQLGKDAILYGPMQSYEPGMPLFQFFFTKTALDFKESYLFLSYSILCLGTLLPITKKMTFKQWYLFPFFVIIFILFPIGLANSNFDSLTYYKTLYIEPALSFFFGFTLFLSIKDNDTLFDYLIFISSLIILVLLKDTGIIFAAGSCITYLIANIVKNKRYQKSKKKYNIKKILAPLIICIALFASWKLIQKVYSTNNVYSGRMNSDEIVTFVTNISPEQKQIIKDFHKAALNRSFDSNFDNIEKYINFYTVFAFIVVTFVLIIYFNKREIRYKYKIATLLYLIVSFIYIIGTLALYIFSLHVVVCFPRYSSVVLVGGITYIFLNTLEGIFNNDTKFKSLALYLAALYVLVTPIKNVSMKMYLYDKADESNYYTEVINKYVDSKKESVLLVFGSSTVKNLDSVIYQHHIYMNLIDEGYKDVPSLIVDNPNEVITNYEELGIIVDSAEKILNILYKYDYVYVIIINEEDKEEFSNLLGMEIDNSILFKVENNTLKQV